MQKTLSFAALALTAALGLSACGSAATTDSGSKSSPSSPSSSSSSVVGLKAGDSVEGGALATRMAAAIVKAGSGGFVMDAGTGGRANGWFTIKDGDLRQQARMTLQGQSLQVVTVDGVIYLQGIPGSTKPWVKIDPKADDALSKAFAGAAGDVADPRQFAKALDGVKATLVSSSAEATVYEATIDPSRLLGESAQSAVPSVGPVTARYTLDSKDRPTKIQLEVQGEAVALTFSGWGEQVAVVAPPADQVGTFELPTS